MKNINEKELNYCKKGHDDDFIIRTLLKKELVNGKTIHVIDLDGDDFFRKRDIDLLLINKKLNTTMAEIKADGFPKLRDNKKYVFLELISNSKKYEDSDGQDGLGCILTSQCDYFIFYFILYDCYLIIESPKLKKFITENKDRYQEKKARTWSPDNSTIWYYSIGYIVPVDDIVTHCSGILKRSRYKYKNEKANLGL